MHVPELLRRPAELIPPSTRSNLSLCADDVHDDLRKNEREIALSVLEDFDGIQWQTVKSWDLLAAWSRCWLVTLMVTSSPRLTGCSGVS